MFRVPWMVFWMSGRGWMNGATLATPLVITSKGPMTSKQRLSLSLTSHQTNAKGLSSGRPCMKTSRWNTMSLNSQQNVQFVFLYFWYFSVIMFTTLTVYGYSYCIYLWFCSACSPIMGHFQKSHINQRWALMTFVFHHHPHESIVSWDGRFFPLTGEITWQFSYQKISGGGFVVVRVVVVDVVVSCCWLLLVVVVVVALLLAVVGYCGSGRNLRYSSVWVISISIKT